MSTNAENRNGFIERLVELRTAAGLTRVEAEDLAGTGQSTFSKWEKGVGFPRASSIEKIAEAFDVEAKWLLTGEGPKQRIGDITTEPNPNVVTTTKTIEKTVTEDIPKMTPVYRNEPITTHQVKEAIVYSAEDQKNLAAVEETIKALKYLHVSYESKRRMHKLLSEIRMEYEATILFGRRKEGKFY